MPLSGVGEEEEERRLGWERDGEGLGNHVDAHLVGQLPGLLSKAWMNSGRMVVCSVCGRMVSRRCKNGMHLTCLASDLAPPVPGFTRASERIRKGGH